MMAAALALALLAAQVAPPAPAKPHRHTPGAGQVRYVTAHRAYLDAGGRDGLAPGDVIYLRRGGRPAGSCQVEAISPDHATCVGEELHPGDTFALAASPPPATAKAGPPPPLTPEETSRRQAALAAAPFPKVEFQGPPRAVRAPVRLPVAEVEVAHALWSSSDATAWNREQLDASLRGADLGRGYRLYADLRALHESARPDGVRFRPGDRTQLYVYEAQVSLRELGLPYTVAVGRVLPWRVPGSTIFDGAQLGWRSARSELGVFGGGVPDLATTEPTLKRSTAGVYFASDGELGPLFMREEGRLAVVTSPELGSRFEGEALGQALLGRDLDLSASVRVGAGGNATAPALLDMVRLDLGLRPIERLTFAAGYRYEGLATPDLAAPARFPGPARHGDVSVSFGPLGVVTVTALGGLADDLQSGLSRQWLGPEVSVPRLFGPRGGMSAGYLQEFGWLAGRSVYLQAVTRPWERLRLLARAAYETAGAPDGTTDADVSLYASCSADVTDRLALRLSAQARASTAGGGEGGSGRPSGVAGTLGLQGRY